MGGGILSPEHVGSSHILASKQLKTGQNGLFWQFLPISHSVDQFFDKNHYKYKVEGHFSLDPLESSNFRASKKLKTAQNGLFWQFSPIWHSVDQFFGWNQLDLTQKSLTIYEGGILGPHQVGSSHIWASNGLFWQFLPIWHSVDQFFGWNQLDLTQKSMTIYEGRVKSELTNVNFFVEGFPKGISVLSCRININNLNLSKP